MKQVLNLGKTSYFVRYIKVVQIVSNDAKEITIISTILLINFSFLSTGGVPKRKTKIESSIVER